MTAISVRGAVKRFGSAAAVDDVTLDIANGEFVALLGASGCGKTTLLRLIAGFETLTEGAIRFGDRLVAGEGAHVPPEKRNVAIVFQSYALWPHMNVAENVGYALRVRGLSKAERDGKVGEALEAVELSGFEDRRPADLSGGQRQRVALARCLAMNPDVILLDEPLANLDVHLRASMEETFRAFHERTGATMVYVTHDQAEAMAMADRIAVMEKGRILQVADPATLYAEPSGERVARFVGNGRVVGCTVLGMAEGGRYRVSLFGGDALVRAGAQAPASGEARLAVKPEGLAIGTEGFPARVRKAVFKGAHTLYEVEPDAAPGLLLPVPDTRRLAIGEVVRVAVRDAWLMPAEHGASGLAEAA
ncbi:ABC transporter ATP-binding protein [Aurantimonas sp. 22II-16-19i]|uniref:ABC transporter ATP-binding protein n=1 Tax=Aurantimonas sp. 22II-16-19i TaxID=1317114 RepID=UPI0009F7FBAE|nr:ABC transporter ATP-binding protein [Aurantimonas sp. 22II-16-19i]ORE98509.1 ABC transporter-like protein [Aurantimonas sp. 22II-16-19i]